MSSPAASSSAGVTEDVAAPAIEREYDRVANVSQRFDLSRATLYRLEERGSIRMVKVGGRTLIEVATLRAYLRNLPKRKGA